MHLEFQWIPISWFRKHSCWEPQQYWIKLRGTRQSWPKQCMPFSTTAGHHMVFPFLRHPGTVKPRTRSKPSATVKLEKLLKEKAWGIFSNILWSYGWLINIIGYWCSCYYPLTWFHILISSHGVSQNDLAVMMGDAWSLWSRHTFSQSPYQIISIINTKIE